MPLDNEYCSALDCLYYESPCIVRLDISRGTTKLKLALTLGLQLLKPMAYSGAGWHTHFSRFFTCLFVVWVIIHTLLLLLHMSFCCVGNHTHTSPASSHVFLFSG
ncbi:hypothetical protein BsWGS_20199 [Bradybaena similaris]